MYKLALRSSSTHISLVIYNPERRLVSENAAKSTRVRLSKGLSICTNKSATSPYGHPLVARKTNHYSTLYVCSGHPHSPQPNQHSSRSRKLPPCYTKFEVCATTEQDNIRTHRQYRFSHRKTRSHKNHFPSRKPVFFNLFFFVPSLFIRCVAISGKITLRMRIVVLVCLSGWAGCFV